MTHILLNTWSQFNSRERAIGCWIAIFLIFSIFKKDIRKSIFGVIFSKNAFQLLFPVITYNVLIIYFFYVYGFWNISFFKDTLYWILGSSLVLFFHISDADKGVKFIYKTIISVVSLTAVMAFIGNLYPFSFGVEFILQPLLIFLSIMSGLGQFFTRKIPGYSSVAKFFEIILLLLGVFLLLRVCFLVLQEHGKLLNMQNLYFFLYPFVLSIFYIPFLYLLRLMMNYESLFIRINPINGGGIENERTIKYGIIKFCHLNLNKLNKFSEFFGRNYFLQEKPDIDVLISNFNKQF